MKKTVVKAHTRMGKKVRSHERMQYRASSGGDEYLKRKNSDEEDDDNYVDGDGSFIARSHGRVKKMNKAKKNSYEQASGMPTAKERTTYASQGQLTASAKRMFRNRRRQPATH